MEQTGRAGPVIAPRTELIPVHPDRSEPRGELPTLLLTLLLLVASLALLGLIGTAPGLTAPVPKIPFWVMAAAFALAELMVLKVELRREGHCFTFNEIPLVIGLFGASPLVLVAGRLVGAGLVLLVRSREGVVKFAFHLGLFLAECAIAIAVFGALRGGAGVANVRSWLAALAAVLTVDALRAVCVATVMRWHGGTPDPATLLLVGSITAVANTTLALVTVLLLSVNLAATSLLAVLAAVLVVAYRAFTSLAARYENLELLYDFTRSVGMSTDADANLHAVLARARETLQAERAEIVLLDRDDEQSILRVTSGDDHPSVVTTIRQRRPVDWLFESVIESDSVLVLDRGTRDPLRSAYLAHRGHRDLLVAPLRTKQRVIGALAVIDRLDGHATFDGPDARLLETLANHAAVALENGRLIDELSREAREREFEALHDGLTGLPNRACFLERVAGHIQTAGAVGCSVMLLDLDRFKDVNDTLGHHSGDVLLAAVARRLRRALTEEAMVARLGGDEFAVLVPGVADSDAAAEVALHLRYVLDEPFEVEGVTIGSGGSIGAALWPAHAGDVASLLKCADVAMYAAKQSDEGVQVYAPESDDCSLKRLTLTPSLRRALRDATLTIQYQPQIHMDDGTLAGVEALARWHHPDFGSVSPDEFVPIAERAGLVGVLTRYVLRAALEQRQRWATEGYDIPVSVNLSPRNLLDESLASDLHGLLEETGTPAHALTLELTESTLMEAKRGIVFLEQVAALGVRLSVDDFGTGYSSLSYLHRLPVTEVKIDKSFVLGLSTDPSNLAIVRSIVDLGHHLGLDVVAEGVEDELSFGRLRSMGCDVAQGYFLSRPAEPRDVARWIQQRSGTHQPALHQ